MLILLAFCTLLLISSAGVFITRRLLRSVVLLAVLSIIIAVIFALLGQALIGILQLIIFIGGLSTFFIVAFGSEPERALRKHEGIFVGEFLAFAIAFGLLLIYAFVKFIPNEQVAESSFMQSVVSAFSQYYLFFYFLSIFVFLISFGSLLVIRRLLKVVA